jgi:hypothetical protein
MNKVQIFLKPIIVLLFMFLMNSVYGATWTRPGCICMHDSSILAVDLKNKCASIVVPTREGLNAC